EAWPKPAAGFLTEVAPPPPEEAVQRPIEDDREHLREGDRVLLIIEDDSKFARILVGMAREKGFKAVVATRGDTGLALSNAQQQGISDLLRGEDVEVTSVATSQKAFEKLEAETFDTVVLDLMLGDEDGERFLEDFKNQPRFQDVPVVVYTGKELSKKEEARL